MFRYNILLLSLLVTTLGKSQNLEFISTEADVQLKIYEKQLNDRIITVSDGEIKVTNYFEDATTKNLIADIQSSEEKDYLGLGLSKWYHCRVSGDTKDRNYNLIVPRSKDKKRIILQEVIGNVLVSNTDFYVN